MNNNGLAPTGYPLAWPISRPRSRSHTLAKFRSGSSRVTISVAADRLMTALRRFGARDIVVSTNVEPTLTGMPSSRAPEPLDPGVAVYFRLHNQPHCLSADKWSRVADNLAAIAKHVDSVRLQLRWGVVEENQVFANVRLLSAVGVHRPWWEVLGVSERATWAVVLAAYEKKIAAAHPDRAKLSPEASGNRAAEINAARDEARAALGM